MDLTSPSTIRGGAVFDPQCLCRVADQRRLRICFVSADYPTTSAGGIGGIGAHTYALAHAVAALGHDVSVLAQGETSAGRQLDGAITVHVLARGSTRVWKAGTLLPVGWIRRSFAVWRALRRLHAERPFDLISFPDGYGEGFRYSYSPFAPYAVQLFGPASLVQRWDGRKVPPVRERAESWIERRPTAHASLVISATRQFSDTMVRAWSLDVSRIRIIRNPLDTDRFHPAYEHAEKGPLRVLFVGHLQRLKGLHTLAAAIPLVASRHPSVEFQLVGNDTKSGPGGMSMRRFLQQTLGEAGHAQRLHFADPMPQSALVALYQSCSAFTLPSLNDVYPNAVLEAMACGRPCVVTSTVGVAELITESESGRVVPPSDPEALAGAIVELLAMPASQREEMGARGRRIVERVCAAPVIANQAVDAYRETIRESAHRFHGRGWPP